MKVKSVDCDYATGSLQGADEVGGVEKIAIAGQRFGR